MSSKKAGKKAQQVTNALGTRHKYTVCNGLMNQLLAHASNIAWAIQASRPVSIPNRFIMDGTQYGNDNVLPNEENSVPLDSIFDTDVLLSALSKLGADAILSDDGFMSTHMPCAPFQKIEDIKDHTHDLVIKVVGCFKPRKDLQAMINNVTSHLLLDKGVCVHHRNGTDWHEHCKRWAHTDDGIPRNNCKGHQNLTFLASLEDRALDSTDKWIYYVGDHDVPQELTNSKYRVYTRTSLLGLKADEKSASNRKGARDLHAFVDYQICSAMRFFVGNSVSTWTAVQLAMRSGQDAYWYNSGSIPLAGLLNVYQIPIVYTFTEATEPIGQYLLQASISSVQDQMPSSIIHVLYQGEQNIGMRAWLNDRGVIVHQHNPEWKNKIEEMRKHGDPKSSPLFLHQGNYFGTWQRIDIPKFINAEYCLYLDIDTLAIKPFSFKDFGMEMTPGLAMSSEDQMSSNRPENAGVVLMNVPYLRRKYNGFIKFIYEHLETPCNYKHGISDQGALLDYYQNVTTFLPQTFNTKAYWIEKEGKDVKILHFHGPKPHHFIDYASQVTCHKGNKHCDKKTPEGVKAQFGVLDNLLGVGSNSGSMVCQSERHFARSLNHASIQAIHGYCSSAFKNRSDMLDACNHIYQDLASEKGTCANFYKYVHVKITQYSMTNITRFGDAA